MLYNVEENGSVGVADHFNVYIKQRRLIGFPSTWREPDVSEKTSLTLM